MAPKNGDVARSLDHRPEKIHALTSLRFFAALFVVLYHTLWKAIPAMTHNSVPGLVISLGFLSVSFFFLLSGYILGMVYLRDGKPVSKKNFYIARFARVYPLFFLTLVADTPNLLMERVHRYGWLVSVEKTAVTFAANVFMLQAWILWLRGIDNPNWSLSVETLFYITFPFLGVWLWRLKGPWLWVVALSIWIGGQVALNLVYAHVTEDTLELNPLLHIASFALGILLARWQTLQRAKHGASPKNSITLSIALLFALAGCLLVVFWHPRLPLAKLNDGLMAPVFALIIWAFSANQSLPARLLSAKWLVVLGEASFGLYLIHYPVYHLFTLFHLDDIPSLFPLYLGTCIGLSVLSFYFVETPLRKWILKRLRSRPKETMEIASDAQ
jgi:peptidoglycan/LPS O-acetylase OafA/YrhL